jgi:hypothetical protein
MGSQIEAYKSIYGTYSPFTLFKTNRVIIVANNCTIIVILIQFNKYIYLFKNKNKYLKV